MKYKVAVLNTGGAMWPAGTSYLRNLFIALKSLPLDTRPHITLLVPTDTVLNDTLTPYIDQVFALPPVDAGSQRLFKKIYGRIPANIASTISKLEMPSKLETFLQRQGIHVLFSQVMKIDLYRSLKIPFISWIPDFQHRHIPNMFSSREIKARDYNFEVAARFSTQVMLSSQCALNDYHNFIPEFALKGRVLSFVSCPPVGIYDVDPLSICDRYHLPERFVYLPNQFWRHKNHSIVIDALFIACKKNPQVKIVCTGGMQEDRDANYVPGLFAKIAEFGLHENFIMLGLIPHIYTFQLIRQSLAVLQPSLFEGWSTTVEETKSVGKAIIISDIPVHREQNPSNAFFFVANDAEALALQLLHVFETQNSGPDLEMEQAAVANLEMRKIAFGQCFMKHVCDLTPGN
ncbi:MAG: hypothetical protein CVU44_14560 [Chloroflexi bacterium HGW-Chloroflexi-6]|nr:MAG: hypothetical protein CVU44_14560 [Chloroflexi bacterium HGW-Chloroflexi-6]